MHILFIYDKTRGLCLITLFFQVKANISLVSIKGDFQYKWKILKDTNHTENGRKKNLPISKSICDFEREANRYKYMHMYIPAEEGTKDKFYLIKKTLKKFSSRHKFKTSAIKKYISRKCCVKIYHYSVFSIVENAP